MQDDRKVCVRFIGIASDLYSCLTPVVFGPLSLARCLWPVVFGQLSLAYADLCAIPGCADGLGRFVPYLTASAMLI